MLIFVLYVEEKCYTELTLIGILSGRVYATTEKPRSYSDLKLQQTCVFENWDGYFPSDNLVQPNL